MGSGTSVWSFAQALRTHWLAAMSGSFSVPFTAAAVFSGDKYQQIIFGCLAFAALWYGAYRLWRFEREKVLDLQRQLVRTGDSPSLRDVSLYDAVCRMFLGRWQKIPVVDGHLDLDASGFQSIHELISQVKQFAFDGRLPIWGKAQGQLAMWEQPKSTFWKNHQIDYLSFTDGDPTELRVVPSNTSGQITSLRDLMTSRSAIDEICRDPSLELPTNDKKSLSIFIGKGEPFEKIEVNRHGTHRTIFIGVKNVGSKKISNCNFYRIYVAHNNDSRKTLLQGPFSLDPNEIRYVSIAMFNERDTSNIEHLIGLSAHPAAFGAGIAPIRLTVTGHHAVSFAAESTDTGNAVLHCELWAGEDGKLRMEPV
jgi:hypothetical protein